MTPLVLNSLAARAGVWFALYRVAPGASLATGGLELVVERPSASIASE